jgi:hypothetical protein
MMKVGTTNKPTAVTAQTEKASHRCSEILLRG